MYDIKKLRFSVWSWQQSGIRRLFNLENLTTNSTLRQSKSIEISNRPRQGTPFLPVGPRQGGLGPPLPPVGQ
jgi:hypothetical protein